VDNQPAFFVSVAYTMAIPQAVSKIRKVEVHPLVLFSILDHYLRRQDGNDRVIGTLIGFRNGDVIEITDCFGVTYVHYANQPLFGRTYNKEMFDLYKRVDPKETIVGWYSTFSDERTLDSISLHFHSEYAEENEKAIHLVVDTSLKEDKINFRAFVSAPVLIGEQALGNTFHQVECEIKMEDDEKLAIHQVVKGREFSRDRKQAESLSRINNDENQLIAPIRTLHSMLGTITDYVDQVVSGKIPANHEVGMRIAEALKSVPQLDPDSYDNIYNRSTQDLLMVSYLSNLTRTQLAIVEKLTESIPPL